MRKFLKRIWTNRSFCIDFALKGTGILFSIWETISLFAPGDELIDRSLPWITRLFMAVLIVIAIFIVVYIIGIAIVAFNNKIVLFDVADGHHVYVQYGDALSAEVLGKGSAPQRNILVSVNRCFDTIVDDDLISNMSLHGQAMNILYASHEYTEKSLNAQIKQKLANQQPVLLNQKDKPRGNLKRYEEGTIAEIKSTAGCTFFFLGLTSFDQMLHPHISDVEYGIALVRALQYCIERNQGYPVVFPLIGGGRAQTRKEEKDILEFIVKLIQMNRAAINCDIHIVVRESAKDSIPILKLKHNL